MATAAASPKPVEIPNRLYFRIGDVVRLTGVKAYVLRYWETEFPMLSPKKSGTNQRLYRRKDVEMLLEIKRLLYEKRYTIEGARTELQAKRGAARAEKAAPAPVMPVTQASLFGPAPGTVEKVQAGLAGVKAELRAIIGLLEERRSK